MTNHKQPCDAFSADFHALVQKGLQSNVPVPFMVMQFEMCKLEIWNMHLMAVRNQEAMAMAQHMAEQADKEKSKIITPNN